MKSSNREEEDFSFPEKVVIVILWFREYMYRTELKKNGYIKKSKSRKICVLLGVLLYSLIALYAVLYRQTD